MSKNVLFSEKHNKIAAMAKALAHPARVAILEMLIRKGNCVCGDIVDELPLSQATVSQHLKAMKDAGILRGEVDGPFRCYCIDSAQCKELSKALITMIESIKNCC